MSTQTIEELQKIIADESRSTEDREAAAKHILVLQGHTEELARQDSKAERRAQFSGEQQRLAEALSRGRQSFNLVERNTDAVVIMDKLASLQIIRLMLDPDGSDGVIYAATNWNSRSNQSLADRMGDHKSQDEANPAYRLRMQSHEDQVTYAKRECATMRTPYVESVPEKKLEDAVRMTSQEFAEFAVSFHRKSLSWQLKGFVYDNLNLPGTAFLPRFIALQKASDDAEEVIYKGAYAAHLRATDQQSAEEEAQCFLGMLACMREMERQAEAKSAERMKNRAPVIEAAPEPEEDDATPVPENTVPWYLQPSYLEEERKKEELSRASASYLI